MSFLATVPLSKCYRLLNHGPTVLITSAHQNTQNVMAASWITPLDFDPPKIIIVVDKSARTRKLIEASGQFAINIPCVAQANQVLLAGSSEGEGGEGKTDKLARCQFSSFAAQKITAPLITGCVGFLECQLIPEAYTQNTYDIFIGEVLAAQADDSVFKDGRWDFAKHDNKRTLHHVAGGHFLSIGKPCEAEITG